MEVDIDFLINTCDKWIKELEGSGEVNKGVMLMCALELFKKEKEREIANGHA